MLCQPSAQRELARKPKRGVVYFVRAEKLGLIKIGFAVNLERRLRELRDGCPDRLRLVAFVGSDDVVALERAMHRKFDAHREHHEWFRPHPEILAYVEEYAAREVKRRPRRAEEIIRESVIARRAATS